MPATVAQRSALALFNCVQLLLQEVLEPNGTRAGRTLLQQEAISIKGYSVFPRRSSTVKIFSPVIHYYPEVEPFTNQISRKQCAMVGVESLLKHRVVLAPLCDPMLSTLLNYQSCGIIPNEPVPPNDAQATTWKEFIEKASYIFVQLWTAGSDDDPKVLAVANSTYDLFGPSAINTNEGRERRSCAGGGWNQSIGAVEHPANIHLLLLIPEPEPQSKLYTIHLQQIPFENPTWSLLRWNHFHNLRITFVADSDKNAL
ncbi:hypothetical protein BDP27DRAFT_1357473 [Rhodocollybia butyracea]|uniref:Uncharacterized protein n=1 Tax=Rhodocollybia butyracea TaxID=206335 RepID=A0A9P5Q8A8_9AGAR|nr:hypothetical protein BDP27DRAFT_1357473 [Rhodocollybia butyracea]